MKRSDRIQYYLSAAEFWRDAAAIQRERSLGNGSDPALARLDLNFYIVAVQRLRGVAEQARDRLRLDAVRSFLHDFDQCWPRVAELRNLEEHTTGPQGGRPSGIWYFKGLAADCRPDGSTESLVDVRAMDPAIGALFQNLCDLLRKELATGPHKSS